MDKRKLQKVIKDNHELRSNFIALIQDKIKNHCNDDFEKRKFGSFLDSVIKNMRAYDEAIYDELEKVIDKHYRIKGPTVRITKIKKTNVKMTKKELKEWEEMVNSL